MSDSEWKNILPKLSYNVLRKSFTEPAFSSRLNSNEKSGYYACRGCKNPLYNSENKYDSGSGWPSFDREIRNNIEYGVDYKIGYPRNFNRNKTKYSKILTTAFQRRFRQELINGIIDQECFLISKNLVKKFK